jgi:hypothetical protein
MAGRDGEKEKVSWLSAILSTAFTDLYSPHEARADNPI